MVKRKAREELQHVPPGTVITYGELAKLCGGGGCLGDNVAASRELNAVPCSERSVPWWRVVSSGSKPLRELLHKEKKRRKIQEDLLLSEGVDLALPLMRSLVASHPLQAIAKPHVLAASGDAKRTLIYLHGMSGFAATYALKYEHFWKKLRKNGTQIVLAQAPLRTCALGADDQVVRSSWFTYDNSVTHDAHPATMAQARGAVESLIATEAGDTDVFVGGHSQGGMVAIDVAMNLVGHGFIPDVSSAIEKADRIRAKRKTVNE